MNGIDKIIDRILDEAKVESEKIISIAAGEAKSLLEDLKEAADRDAAAVKDEGRALAQSKAERLSGTAESERKREILKAKQELIDEAFSRALKLIRELPRKDHINFLAKRAVSALTDGTDKIILNASDRTEIAQELLAEINSAAAARGLRTEVALSDTVGTFQGGLIVVHGKVETNATVDALLRNLRETMAGEIADRLFG